MSLYRRAHARDGSTLVLCESTARATELGGAPRVSPLTMEEFLVPIPTALVHS